MTYTNTQYGRMIVWLLALVGIAVALFFVFRTDRTELSPQQPGDVNGANAEVVVIEGEVVCLPHRDTSGPTTMECLYGVRTDDGSYYGLNAEELSEEKQGGYDVGQRVSFEGVLVERGAIPSSFWETYNIVGILTVADYWVYRDK